MADKFKSVEIKEGKTPSVKVNKKPVKYINVKTIDNKEFSIEWDSNYKGYVITVAKGTLKVLGDDENYFCFKIVK